MISANFDVLTAAHLSFFFLPPSFFLFFLVDFSCETQRLHAREYFRRLADPMEIRFFAPQAPVYGWKRRVGLCLDKRQGPVIRWRDDFLIIAPSSGAPSGLVAGEPRVRVHVNP